MHIRFFFCNFAVRKAVAFVRKTAVARISTKTEMNTDIDKLIVVGDRVLVKPTNVADKTKSGLYLPAGYQEKETVQTGYILKCGPGYPLPPMDADVSEPWNPQKSAQNYIPLQVKPGDLAIFLQKAATEIKYNGEKFFILPQNAILLVERDEF